MGYVRCWIESRECCRCNLEEKLAAANAQGWYCCTYSNQADGFILFILGPSALELMAFSSFWMAEWIFLRLHTLSQPAVFAGLCCLLNQSNHLSLQPLNKTAKWQHFLKCLTVLLNVCVDKSWHPPRSQRKTEASISLYEPSHPWPGVAASGAEWLLFAHVDSVEICRLHPTCLHTHTAIHKAACMLDTPLPQVSPWLQTSSRLSLGLMGETGGATRRPVFTIGKTVNQFTLLHMTGLCLAEEPSQ